MIAGVVRASSSKLTDPETCEKLRGIQPNLSCLVKEERRGQHSGGSIRIVQVNSTVWLNESIDARVHVKSKKVKELLTLFSDCFDLLRRQINRGDLSAQSSQVL